MKRNLKPRLMLIQHPKNCLDYRKVLVSESILEKFVSMEVLTSVNQCQPALTGVGNWGLTEAICPPPPPPPPPSSLVLPHSGLLLLSWVSVF